MKLQHRQASKIIFYIFTLSVLLISFQNCGNGFQTALNQKSTQNNASNSLSTLSAEIAWDKSSSAGVLGYRIYLGTRSGIYESVFDTNTSTDPLLPEYEIQNLPIGMDHYAVVKAYDSISNESTASNEILISDK